MLVPVILATIGTFFYLISNFRTFRAKTRPSYLALFAGMISIFLWFYVYTGGTDYGAYIPMLVMIVCSLILIRFA